MGGDDYERDVTPATTGATYSSTSDQIFNRQIVIDPTCNALNRQVHTFTQSPVVVALDVTGSMGDFPRVVFDKLPMFYGNSKKYVPDPSIAFCAIGDVDHDKAPFQLTDFAAKGSDIDNWISKLYIEGGGGDPPESYEYVPLYFGQVTEHKVSTNKGFMFITGDECMKSDSPEKIRTKCRELFGFEPVGSLTNKDIFDRCLKKFYIFYLCKTPSGVVADNIQKQWGSLIGPGNVLPLMTAKAVCDIMLGCIAIVSGARTLDEYVQDLEFRGQSEERIAEVMNALGNLTP
eukprot:PhF_6_TR32415/c0_g1_i1/m.48097